ncbi:MarR family winged helix-turn-helix transcriptional regulator [Mycolicibacterium sp. CBM1]
MTVPAGQDLHGDDSPMPLPPRSDGGDDEPRTDGRVTISDLTSYRLSRVANSLSRSAALTYRRECDVSLGEWRVLALLGERGSLTLNKLARRSALDKAQMSRVVKGLVERGLIDRDYGPGRTTELSLSPEGQRVYARLLDLANERDRRIRRHLGSRDQIALTRALDTLTRLAFFMEEEETAAK